MSALAGLTAAITIAGVLLVGAGLRRQAEPAAPSRTLTARAKATFGSTGGDRSTSHRAQLVIAAVAGAIAWLVTGWPVAGFGTAVAAAWLPWLTGRNRTASRIDRLEALEQWTRRLADLLVVGSGIEQALVVSVRTVPAPIAAEVEALAARLQARTPTEMAIRAFAEDLDDPAGDLVASALILATRRRGRGLAQVLDGLARAVSEEVAVRRGIDADRAKPRTTARAVTWIAIGAAVSLILLDRAYVSPFGTALGQAVLAAVLALFIAAFAWMHQLATVATDRRFLPPDPHGAHRPPIAQRGAP